MMEIKQTTKAQKLGGVSNQKDFGRKMVLRFPCLLRGKDLY